MKLGIVVSFSLDRRVSRTAMRRIIGICLVLFYWLGPAMTLVPASEESRLPACCRRGGPHHCMMSMAELASVEDGHPHLSAPSPICPYCPARLAASHSPHSLHQSIPGNLISPSSRPSGVVQSKSRRRICRDRAWSKRGPPQSQLL